MPRKKIDILFSEFPKLSIIRSEIQDVISSKKFHPLQNVFRRYSVRKRKYIDEAVRILNESEAETEDYCWAFFYVNYHYYGNAFLKHLNNCFIELENVERFRSQIRKMLNSEQFFDTISELEFNAYFSGRYPIRIEPKIEYEKGKFKTPDSSINIDGREVFIEIITPRPYKHLMESKAVIRVPHRSKNKILDKLKQLVPISQTTKKPIIFVINGSYSDINEIDIRNAIFGQEKVVIETNPETGKTINIYLNRKNNSVIETNPSASCISAIIYYRKWLNPWGIEFQKEIFVTKNPDNRLSANEYRALNRFNLKNMTSSSE